MVPLVWGDRTPGRRLAGRYSRADAHVSAAPGPAGLAGREHRLADAEEVNRVAKPEGRIVLLEHVRVNAPVISPLMDLFDPVVLRLMGPHINRRTAENVKKAGLQIEQVEELAAGGLVKLILARSKRAGRP